MNLAEEGASKRYCIRPKHVAIICATVVAVGLIVGLSVGLTRTCPPPPEEENRPTDPTSGPPQNVGACPASEEDGPWTAFRLPAFLTPQHYDLEVQPRLLEDTYSGTVNITLQLTQATSHLWLHLRETWISRLPQLRGSSGGQLAVKRCFEYRAQEFVVVEAAQALQPGAYVLTLDFAGYLNGSLVGFYRTTYVENGQVKSIAATDHEPTDARKSFPCFDEPNKKATYNISIVHSSDYKALSNMPVLDSVNLNNGWVRTRFQKSVPMSTYLVCFAVHQFAAVTRTSARGIPLTVYVQPQQQHTAEYAADVTKIVFDYFEKYFGMDYSLPKLDKIAIPDFGTGAMENWGLITYRETSLLYDPKESASSNKQRVASVVAHELVHQWFGNIVTMDWWEDLWLNEGFASFFEVLGVNEAEGTWQMREQMLLEDVFPVQEDDSLMSSHPIIVTVSTPAEITSVFDGISYSKGASILRMLEDWITPEKFQEGCRIYLKKYKFQNAKTSDFWAALEEASGQPVKEVMDTWTSQMGYPVLDVNGRTVVQKRFLLDSKADPTQPPSNFRYTWNIPVKWSEDQQSAIKVYNRSEKDGINLEPQSSGGNAFLKVNPDHIGFYRVNYEESVWTQIADSLQNNNSQNFSSADRASFIDDGFALARAQLIKYSDALNLTRYLHAEKDYLPWQRAISAVTYVISMFEDDNELYPKIEVLAGKRSYSYTLDRRTVRLYSGKAVLFDLARSFGRDAHGAAYFQKKVKPIADSLGWTDEGEHVQRLLRASVLGFACKMKDPTALRQASEEFQRWLNDPLYSIPVNLRLLAYRYGMQSSGNESSWNYVLEQYQKTPLAQEKEKLLYGLASVSNVTLLSRFLELVKDPNVIKSQDVFTVIRYISYNPHGKVMAWNWLQLNWDYLIDRYTLNDRTFGRIVTIAEPFNTELQLWQMESFFAKYPEAGAGEMPRKQVLETVKNNIEWLKLNRESIQKWFENI